MLVRLGRRKKLKKLLRPTKVTSRRAFMVSGGVLLAAGATGSVFRLLSGSPRASERSYSPIRPPTASADDAEFRAACIGCGLCGTVCENGCIVFFGIDEPTHGSLTPFLNVRRRSCTLCMRCTNICPTDALRGVEDDLEVIAEQIDMGTAVVDPDRCLSYLGRICGYCHDACPLPNQAIVLVPPARPVILEDGCVGCGRCVELCPQTPTAIDVFREVRA